FETLRGSLGATHSLTRTLDKVRTEMSLHVLAYNLKRMITIFGVGQLMAAIRTLPTRSSRTRHSVDRRLRRQHRQTHPRRQPRMTRFSTASGDSYRMIISGIELSMFKRCSILSRAKSYMPYGTSMATGPAQS